MTNQQNPEVVYRERALRFDGEAAAKQKAVVAYARFRLLVFLMVLGASWLTISQGWGRPGWTGVAVLTGIFAVLISGHRRARRRLRRVELMADFNREMTTRIARSWDQIPEPPELTVPADHDYARDLDLMGPGSLLHLLGTCGTGPGWKTLTSWLLAGSDSDSVTERQVAVRELAGALDFRDALAAEARLMDPGRSPEVERFLKWAEGEPWLTGRRRWLIGASYTLPVVNLIAIGAYWVGLVPTAAVVWTLAVSGLVLFPFVRSIHGVFAEADGGEAGVREYGPLLALLAGPDFSAPLLAGLRARLDVGERAADREISTLRRLLDLADIRRSPLFHLPLASVLLWDVHVLAALERWQRRAGPHVRDWTDAIGESEALSALGAIAHAHPAWAFPTLDPAADRLDGRALAHPLIAPTDAVPNDVTVGPPGRFLLVTGSNMTGKSTLLRALGLNVVLARAGAPVCASRLRLGPLRVCTSMRVDDSLAGGVSFFMAELYRLKQVVDVAEAGPEGSTLYLLDEILQGTNTAERRVAARAVIRRLLASGAIGAVTTHDLTLAAAKDLEARADAVHFTEMVGGQEAGLSFDYELREGLAKSTNALKLLDLVGLGEGG